MKEIWLINVSISREDTDLANGECKHTYDFGDYKGGFKLRPNGGIVMENMKLSSNGMSSEYTMFDAWEYMNKYHGTAAHTTAPSPLFLRNTR